MVESVGGLRGGGLPCGGCQQFESAYLQVVNLAQTKLYGSTQFFRFGSSIYDLSFMDGEVQTRKGLQWIPRHPETRKGIVSDEMLQGVENKLRSGDSRIGQPFELLLNPWADKRHPDELKHLSSWRKRKQIVVLLGKVVKCRTLDGYSLVAESITSLCSDPSSMGHVESCVNHQGPPCKAKYS
ncbi:hypothetical protein GQ457_04G021990 [Hibiscus cannabinus]